jgi:hypothetical protein
MAPIVVGLAGTQPHAELSCPHVFVAATSWALASWRGSWKRPRRASIAPIVDGEAVEPLQAHPMASAAGAPRSVVDDVPGSSSAS